MINAILGTKLGQTQKYTSDGKRIPVTKILAGPCVVVQKGSNFVQLGVGETKRTKKSMLGHIKKAGLEKAPLFLREVPVDSGENLKPGERVMVGDVLRAGDIVDVVGISKGKGFTGVVKRWGFAGGPRTHGQSDRERAPGSIGTTTTPGRVLKGKKMAGRKGQERVTIKNLKVFEVDSEKNLVLVTGLVPGAKRGRLIIKRVSMRVEGDSNEKPAITESTETRSESTEAVVTEKEGTDDKLPAADTETTEKADKAEGEKSG